MTPPNVLAADPVPLANGWRLPDRGAVGSLMLILTEAVLFAMFAAAYLVYIGQSNTGPYPNDVLRTPILSTICLLSSSITIVFAERALQRNQPGLFKVWWL